MTKLQQHCYDFPELVSHGDGSCPRYNGGICHPLPTPVPPYTEEEQEVVDAYNEFMSGRVPFILIKASGSTILPGEEGKA